MPLLFLNTKYTKVTKACPEFVEGKDVYKMTPPFPLCVLGVLSVEDFPRPMEESR